MTGPRPKPSAKSSTTPATNADSPGSHDNRPYRIVDVVEVSLDSSVHRRVCLRLVVDLEGVPSQNLDWDRSRSPEGVVLEQAIAIPKVDGRDRCLRHLSVM